MTANKQWTAAPVTALGNRSAGWVIVGAKLTEPKYKYVLLRNTKFTNKRIAAKKADHSESGCALMVSETDLRRLGDTSAGEIACEYRAASLTERIRYTTGAAMKLSVALLVFLVAVGGIVAELATRLKEHALPSGVVIAISAVAFVLAVVILVLTICGTAPPGAEG
jgi:hypothetical protein